MHTLEKNISLKLRIEVENVVATVESRVDEAILSAMDCLVMSRMELAMRPVGVFSAPNRSNVVLDFDQRDSLGDTNDLHMTASSILTQMHT